MLFEPIDTLPVNDAPASVGLVEGWIVVAMLTSLEPSNDTVPVIGPVRLMLRAVSSLVAVSALPCRAPVTCVTTMLPDESRITSVLGVLADVAASIVLV